MKEQSLPAIVLIGVGLFLLAINQLHISGELIVAGLGAFFLMGYLHTRNYGLLIPGCILTGLGTGIVLQSTLPGSNGAPVVLGLAAGFASIYLVDRVANPRRPGGWWPLVPGGILGLVGSLVAVEATGLLGLIARWWPLLLVLAGLRMLTQQRSGNTSPALGSGQVADARLAASPAAAAQVGTSPLISSQPAATSSSPIAARPEGHRPEGE